MAGLLAIGGCSGDDAADRPRSTTTTAPSPERPSYDGPRPGEPDPTAAELQCRPEVRPEPLAAHPTEVVLQIWDAAGERVVWNAVRRLQTDGEGRAEIDDVLLDPVTEEVVENRPVHPSATTPADPSVTWPGHPETLALSWPTGEGRTRAVVDLPGPGIWSFPHLAADTLAARLDATLADHPKLVPSAELVALCNGLHDALVAAATRHPYVSPGAPAAALDGGARAMDLLLAQLGEDDPPR
ncbi:hypothetical protein [Iamia sp.]|uniref:hypothetical protein n=1 Tax=Iamia sp. TaxID=2722710 RepID=UPI002BCF7F88|nr:hypothetical protein [Iamia sp.]HXH58824.1 hypothetical protein [Iamia sp.]